MFFRWIYRSRLGSDAYQSRSHVSSCSARCVLRLREDGVSFWFCPCGCGSRPRFLSFGLRPCSISDASILHICLFVVSIGRLGSMLDVATSCACSDPSAWWFQPVGSCSSDVCLSLRSFAFLFHRIRRVHPRLFLLPPPTILRAPFPHAHLRRRGTHLSTTTGGSRPFRSFLDVFRVHSFPMGVFRDGTVRTFHPPVPTPRSDASRCAAHVAMAHNVVVVVVVAAVSKRSRTQPIQKPKKEEKIPSTNELKNEKKKRERKEGRIPRPYVKGRGRGTGRRRERWDGMRSSALVERDDATCAVGRCVSSRPLPSPRQTRKERCARTQGQEGRRAWTRSIEKERCDVPTVRGNRGVPRPRHALESFHAPTTRANGREGGAHARLAPSVGRTSPLTSPYPVAAEASPLPPFPPISFLCASCAIFLDAFLRVQPSGFRPTEPGRAPFQVFSIALRFLTRFFVPIDLVSIGPFVPSRRWLGPFRKGRGRRVVS